VQLNRWLSGKAVLPRREQSRWTQPPTPKTRLQAMKQVTLIAR
jgi:hypothetical protein